MNIIKTQVFDVDGRLFSQQKNTRTHHRVFGDLKKSFEWSGRHVSITCTRLVRGSNSPSSPYLSLSLSLAHGRFVLIRSYPSSHLCFLHPKTELSKSPSCNKPLASGLLPLPHELARKHHDLRRDGCAPRPWPWALNTCTFATARPHGLHCLLRKKPIAEFIPFLPSFPLTGLISSFCSCPLLADF